MINQIPDYCAEHNEPVFKYDAEGGRCWKCYYKSYNKFLQHYPEFKKIITKPVNTFSNNLKAAFAAKNLALIKARRKR